MSNEGYVKIGREDLLHSLESVSPGLSPKETIKQSSFFVFKGGRVYTFNEMMLCSADAGFDPGDPIAVPSKALVKAVSRMPDEEIRVGVKKGKLEIRGAAGRAVVVAADPVILLPISAVPRPAKGTALDEAFSDALSIVQECAGNDVKQWISTCVHVHPKYLEAFDNCQLCRYRIKTGVGEACLIERDAIRHVVASGVNEIVETEGWLHFLSPDGLHLACRRFVENFPRIGHAFEVQGEAVELPKSLADAVDMVEPFAEEDLDDPLVTVRISAGEMEIRADGVSGFAVDFKDIYYQGPELEFATKPKLLKSITDKSSRVIVADDRLMVDGDVWRYVTVLQKKERE